jgi:hypothetical protein
MNIEALRKWLMAVPRPTVVKLQVGSAVQTIDIPKTCTWKNLAVSIDTINPETIELYGPDAKLLRAGKAEQFDDDVPDESPGAVDLGKMTDAETQRFVVVAQLLADAHKFSEVAFDKLVAILDSQVRKAESSERTLATTERLLREEMQEKLELMAAKDPDLLEELIGAFASGRAQAVGAKSAVPPTNGKAKQI